MGSDRRQFARQSMEDRPAKVRRSVDGRYLPARTVDLSAGGALLKLDWPSQVGVGESLEVTVAAHPREAVVPAKRLQSATVVRKLDYAGRPCVAVAFAEPQTEPLAAAG